jgi:hypothetical protein
LFAFPDAEREIAVVVLQPFRYAFSFSSGPRSPLARKLVVANCRALLGVAEVAFMFAPAHGFTFLEPPATPATGSTTHDAHVNAPHAAIGNKMSATRIFRTVFMASPP